MSTTMGGDTSRSDPQDQLSQDVWRALEDVMDPELGLDLVSLGLIYGVSATSGDIRVTMTLTTPGCPAAESMPELARWAIEEAVGAQHGVSVALVWDPPWNPSMMSDGAARDLGFRR